MVQVLEERAAGTPGDDREAAPKPIGLSESDTRRCRSLLRTMSSLVEAAGRTNDPFEHSGFWESYRELQLHLDLMVPFGTCLTRAP